MDPNDIERLHRNWKDLLEVNSDDIMPDLIQDLIFDTDAMEEISHQGIRKKKTEMMLLKLTKRGPKAYPSFRKALQEFDVYHHLVQKLDLTQCGNLLVTQPSGDETDVGPSSKPGTLRSDLGPPTPAPEVARTPFTDLECLDLADLLDQERDFPRLGLCLKFPDPTLSRYRRENSGGSSSGTYKMLVDWKKQYLDHEHREHLSLALDNAGLKTLASQVRYGQKLEIVTSPVLYGASYSAMSCQSSGPTMPSTSGFNPPIDPPGSLRAPLANPIGIGQGLGLNTRLPRHTHPSHGLGEASGVSESTESSTSAGVDIPPPIATLQGAYYQHDQRHYRTDLETNLDDTQETFNHFNAESVQQSGVIRLDKHQIEIQIPPGEKLTEKDVRVRAITRVPPELADILKERQAIICVGLEISSRATFSKPVKVTMPHSAVFTNPDGASIGAYSRKTSDDSFLFTSVTNGNLRCDVRGRDLDLYLDHFSEWWIIALITSVFLGKRLICTPHVPISTKMYDEHLMVLCIRDDNAGKEEVEPGYIAPVKGAGFSLKWFAGPLTVTCKADTKDMGGKEVEASVFHQYIEENIQFLVKTSGITKSRIFVEFTMEQKTTKNILCPMNLSDTLVSGATGSSASAATLNPHGSTSVWFIPSGEAVSEDSLNMLAIYVPIESYYVLSEKLGIEHNPAKNLFIKYGKDSTSAIRECLGTWKNRTGGSLVELRQILMSSKLGGLVQYLK